MSPAPWPGLHTPHPAPPWLISLENRAALLVPLILGPRSVPAGSRPRTSERDEQMLLLGPREQSPCSWFKQGCTSLWENRLCLRPHHRH